MRKIKFRAWDNRNGGDMFYPPMDIIGRMMVEELPEYVTFMQFTGLLDKNGKGNEVYEGDIIYFTEFYEAGGLEGSREGDRQHKEKIYWNTEECAWYAGDFSLAWIINQDDSWEIIGNVYEHPELLVREE